MRTEKLYVHHVYILNFKTGDTCLGPWVYTPKRYHVVILDVRGRPFSSHEMDNAAILKSRFPRPFSSLNFRTYEPPGETATTAWRGMVSLATGGYRGATDFAQPPQAAFAFMMLAVCQTAWTLAAIWMVGMHGRTWFTGDSQKKLSAAGKCERREAMRSRHAQSERAIGVNAAKQVPRPASMSSSTADLLQCAGSCTCEEMRAATWRALETIGGELTSEMAKEGCVDEPERVMLFVRSVQQSTASLTCRHCLQS